MSVIVSMPVLCIETINISIEKDNKIITESIRACLKNTNHLFQPD